MKPETAPRPRTIRNFWMAFAVVLALTLVGGLFVRTEGHEGLGATFGFGAWFGFAACAALILFAKGLGIFLKRPDRYYEHRDE